MAVVTKLTVKEIQQAIVYSYSKTEYRNNIFVPNLSWGLLSYEADLIIMNKSGYLTECEIKRSWEDFMADFKKDHQHNDERVYKFRFYLPEILENKAKGFLEQFYSDKPMNTPALFVYDEEGKIRRCKDEDGRVFGYEHRMYNCRKLFIEEQLQVARLGCMRLWKN